MDLTLRKRQRYVHSMPKWTRDGERARVPLGIQLRAWRQEAGLSVEDVNKILGWAPGRAASLEEGRATLYFDDAIGLLRAYGQPSSALDALAGALERDVDSPNEAPSSAVDPSREHSSDRRRARR